MAKAGRHHAIRSLIAALLLAVITFTGMTIRQQGIVQRNATHAIGLMDSLLKADIAQVLTVVSDLSNYRERSDPLLRAKLAAATDGSKAKLRLSLALLPVDVAGAWTTQRVETLEDRTLLVGDLNKSGALMR